MSFSTVYRLFTKFGSSQESVKDAPHSGRPRYAVTKSNINKITSITEKDACFTVRHLAQMTNLGLASVHSILKKIFKVMKTSVRWIPNLLIDQQKPTRVQMAKQLLKKYPKYQKRGPWATIRSPAYLQMPCNSLPVLPQQLGHKFDHTIKRSKVILVSFYLIMKYFLRSFSPFR